MEHVAFLVPTTSKDREWNNFRESYLNQVLLPSITKLSHSFKITCYIGYDDDDRLLSNINYFQVCGDDISFDKRTEWLGKFLKLLKKQNNIGFVSGYSNNDSIPTQFLIHKKHIDNFGWIFPPPIHNWFCDDFLAGLYSEKGIWLKEYKHLNIGGQPRYTPNNDKNLCYLLIKRYKKNLYLLN